MCEMLCYENWPNCVKSHMREIQFGKPFPFKQSTSCHPNVVKIIKKIVEKL